MTSKPAARASARETAQSARLGDVLRAVLDQMGDGVIVADANGAFLEFNPAAREMLGLPPGADASEWELHYRLFAADGVTPLPEEMRPLHRALRGEQLDQEELFVRGGQRPQGLWISVTARPLLDRRGTIKGGVVVLREVTEQRRARETLEREKEMLKSLSLDDELTGLKNRRGLLALAEQQWRVAERSGRPILVVFADLDGLKAINDQFGHEAGDQALADAARILRETFRASDVIGRLGGDEFVVVGVDVSAPHVLTLMNRLGQRLKLHHEQAGRRFTLRMSVGWVLSTPGSGDTLDTLLARADEKMYAEKRRAHDQADDESSGFWHG